MDFECVFEFGGSIPRSISSSVANILLPFALLLLLLIVFALHAALARIPLGQLTQRWTLLFLAVFYIAFMDMTRNVVNIFDCTDVDSKEDQSGVYSIATSRYWVEDTDVVCREGDHLILTWALAVPVTVLIIFGFPIGLLLFFLLHSGDLSQQESMETYGFLYWSYRPAYKYWEFMILLRKACLATISVFSTNLGANLQSALASVVLMVAVVSHQWARPYVTSGPNLHRMETLSLSCSILTFLSGLIFNDPSNSDGGRVVVSVVVVTAVGIVFSYLVSQYIKAALRRLDTFLETHGVKVDSNMTLIAKIGKAAGLVRQDFQYLWSKRIHARKQRTASS